MRASAPALACLLALLAPGLSAAAAASDFQPFFQSGVRLHKAMDFERALEQFQLARAQPHSADEDVQVSLYQGILLFELGQEAEAAEAFRTALSVRPQAALPVAVSPRIQLSFEKERAALAKLSPPAPPAKAEPEAPKPAPAAAVVEKSPSPSRGRTIGGAVLTGLGAASVVVGAIAYGSAWANYPKVERGEATRAEAEEVDLDAKAGVGLLVAGGVLLVPGVVLLALPDGSSATVTLAPGRGGASACLSGTFP